MNLYGQSQLDKLVESGFNYTILQEGSLLDGLVLLTKTGYKSIIAREVYLNEWSSAYSVRIYNTLPRKYQELLRKLEEL